MRVSDLAAAKRSFNEESVTCRVAVAWAGLPLYAARALRTAAENKPAGASLHAICVNSEGLSTEAASLMGGNCSWLDETKRQRWAECGLETPNVLFVGGWATPQLRALTSDARVRGARVITFCDNRLTGRLKQRLALLHKRMTGFATCYDAAWVPGDAAHHFALRLGLPANRIHSGLYCGDDTVFCVRQPLCQRPRRFIYIGQFISRKNVSFLYRSFLKYAARYPEDDTELHMYGEGPLRRDLASQGRIFVHGPADPSVLAEALNECRCLVLPSLNENWGLVVHEAALSGCALIVSDAVGSIPELVRPANAEIVGTRDVEGLVAAFHRVAIMDKRQLDEAQRVSVALASRYTLANWARQFWSLAGFDVPAKASHGSM